MSVRLGAPLSAVPAFKEVGMREHGVGGAMGLAGGRFADPDIDSLFGGVGEDEVLAIGAPAVLRY